MKKIFLFLLALAPISCVAATYTCVKPGGIVFHQVAPCETEKNMRTHERPMARMPREEYQEKVESIRRKARDKDPTKADRICAEAEAKEKAILSSDRLAEQLRSIDLFDLRSRQDLYCKEYKARNIRSNVR